jgi:hypothetical protein
VNAHIKQVTRRKIADFIRLEDGQIGNRSAFTVAALAGASALGAALFGASMANADGADIHCHPNHGDCPEGHECVYVADTEHHYHCH